MQIPNFENFQPLFPMAYLVLGAAIAVVGHKFALPPEITGMLVGAALTRVKMPPNKATKKDGGSDKNTPPPG